MSMMSSVREINIKYHRHYYSDDIINIKDFDLNKILVCEKPYQNNLVYRIANNFSVLILIKYIDILKSSENRYLELFHLEKKIKRFNRIKYLISQKNNISDVYYRNYVKIGINLNYDLLLEKANIRNTIIFIGRIFNNNFNNHHHGVCLAKCSCKIPEKM